MGNLAQNLMKKGQEATDLQRALTHCKGSFFSVGFFSMFVNMLMLAPVMYMLQVYDRVITTKSENTLLMLTLLVMFLFMVMGGLEIVRSRLMGRVGNRLDTMINHRLYSAMFRRSIAIQGHQSAQPLSDLSQLRTFLSSRTLFAFFDAPWTPIYIGVMFLFHPWLGMFAIVAAVVLIALAITNEKSTQKLLSEAGNEQIQAQSLANSNLRNAEVMYAMGMLSSIMGRWSKRHHTFLSKQAQASDRAGVLTHTSKVFRMMAQSLAIGLAAFLVLKGDLSPGMVIAGSVLMGRALAPLDQLIGGWKGFVGARNAYSRLNELLRQIPAEYRHMSLPAPRGHISVEGVAAAPPGTRMAAIRGVSFAVSKGEHVGIIGPSAAGNLHLHVCCWECGRVKSVRCVLILGILPTITAMKLGPILVIYLRTLSYLMARSMKILRDLGRSIRRKLLMRRKKRTCMK